jgi:hypothetical protein
MTADPQLLAADKRRVPFHGGPPSAHWWLDRYLSDGKPGFQHFAEITASLAKRGSTTET